MKPKKLSSILLIVFLLGLLLPGGGYLAYRAYLKAREAHLVKQAQGYLAKPEPRKALLCVQRVLRSNPRNVEACRLMATLMEASRSPGCLAWRSRAVELDPHSLADRFRLAQCALVFHQCALASQALAGVPLNARKTGVYHNLAGEVACANGDRLQAEADFLEAVRLEPTNPAPSLNLAVVRLHGTNAATLAAARASLTQISVANSRLRCQALRELVMDAVRFQQTNVAVQLSRELVQQTNSDFSDQLLRLEALQVSQNPGFEPALSVLEHESAANPARICELGQWQMNRNGPAAALAWLRSLPLNFQTHQSLALLELTAQCQTLLADWRGLQTSLKSQNWADSEFERHAILAHALRKQELTSAAKAEWDLALKLAEGRKESLDRLLHLAVDWQWQSESEELLWTIVNAFPAEKGAFLALNQLLYSKALHDLNPNGRNSSLRPLLLLYSQELKRSPSNLGVKNNLALIALLLDAQELNPYSLAHDVYQQSPTNPAFISTYAFSLHLQKRDAEALKVIEQIKPEEFQSPTLAGYYGLVLQATGNHEKARSYLEQAGQGPILPEERKLFARAKAGN